MNVVFPGSVIPQQSYALSAFTRRLTSENSCFSPYALEKPFGFKHDVSSKIPPGSEALIVLAIVGFLVFSMRSMRCWMDMARRYKVRLLIPQPFMRSSVKAQLLQRLACSLLALLQLQIKPGLLFPPCKRIAFRNKIPHGCRKSPMIRFGNLDPENTGRGCREHCTFKLVMYASPATTFLNPDDWSVHPKCPAFFQQESGQIGFLVFSPPESMSKACCRMSSESPAVADPSVSTSISYPPPDAKRFVRRSYSFRTLPDAPTGHLRLHLHPPYPAGPGRQNARLLYHTRRDTG